MVERERLQRRVGIVVEVIDLIAASECVSKGGVKRTLDD
jgi:selenophosphate synthetase-related protein